MRLDLHKEPACKLLVVNYNLSIGYQEKILSLIRFLVFFPTTDARLRFISFMNRFCVPLINIHIGGLLIILLFIFCLLLIVCVCVCVWHLG